MASSIGRPSHNVLVTTPRVYLFAPPTLWHRLFRPSNRLEEVSLIRTTDTSILREVVCVLLSYPSKRSPTVPARFHDSLDPSSEDRTCPVFHCNLHNCFQSFNEFHSIMNFSLFRFATDPPSPVTHLALSNEDQPPLSFKFRLSTQIS